MPDIEVRASDDLPFPSSFGIKPPRRCRRDEKQFTFARQFDGNRQRTPRNIRCIGRAKVEHFNELVRRACRNGIATITLCTWRRDCHALRLMSAVKICIFEKFCELIALGSLNDFLKRDEIGIERAQLAVDELNSPRIAFLVPDIE
jgi:hypothetical protein